MSPQILDDVHTLWSYLRREESKLVPADALLLLGSHDIRVADHAARLYNEGFAKLLIVSGGLAPRTKAIFGEAEAVAFARRIQAAGVPDSVILQEDKALNTAENVLYTYQLLQQRQIVVRSLILVQKPYMTRRAYATFMAQWPGYPMKVQTSSVSQTFEEYIGEDLNAEMVINTMVGDMQRIKEYPKRGFQIEQPIPHKVWEAFKRLVDAGYTEHLI